MGAEIRIAPHTGYKGNRNTSTGRHTQRPMDTSFIHEDTPKRKIGTLRKGSHRLGPPDATRSAPQFPYDKLFGKFLQTITRRFGRTVSPWPKSAIHIVANKSLQSLHFPKKSNSMSAIRIEASFPQPLLRSRGSDMKHREVESSSGFDDEYEALRDQQIGTRDPDTSFERFFWVNLKLLEGLGLFSMKFRLSGRLVNTNTRTVLPVLFSVSQMVFLIVCEFRAFRRFWTTDADRAITVFTALVPTALCIFQGLRLWMCQVELRELLIHLAVLWEKSRFQMNVRQRILKIAERTGYFRSCYLGMVTSIVMCYGMRPYLLLLQFKLNHEPNEVYDYSVTGIPAVYPVSIDTSVKYLACINWEIFIGFLLGVYSTASDTMFAQLVSHSAIQFQVLHYDLKSIGAESKITNAKDEQILLRKLCSIAKRHRQLFELCNMIAAIYNPTIFMIMMSTAVTMCFCALNVQKALKNGNHEEVVKNIAHLVAGVGQLMIYCVYADNLSEQNLKIAQASYQCHWIERSKSFKINLQIIMMRAQKYYGLSGYGFFNLTLAQITAIVNTTMSYFTLLNTLT